MLSDGGCVEVRDTLIFIPQTYSEILLYTNPLVVVEVLKLIECVLTHGTAHCLVSYHLMSVLL